jgi:tetratricopeptide (TPR) repeat protein
MAPRSTQDIPPRLNQAVDAHRTGNLDAADRLYDRILKIDRNNADALNLKGLVMSARGDHTQALAFYDRGLKTAPAFADLHANRGNALAALGRGDEALTAFGQAVKLKPGHLEAWLNAGTLFHRAGRFKEAVTTFRAAAAACPDVRVFYNLGMCLRDLAAQPDEDAQTHRDEAVAAFARAVILDPSFAPAQIAQSAALAVAGVYDKAITHLLSAIALKAAASDQEKRELLNNLGELFRKNRQLDRAIDTQRQALLLGPDDRTIRYNLALTLAAAGDIGEAEEIYLRLIESDPSFLKPYINLANIYRDRNRTGDAIRLCERALDVDPALHEAYTNIGANFADRGWLFAAVLLHHKALSFSPADPESGLNFAVNLLRLGRFHEGWPYYDSRFELLNPPNRATPPKMWEGEDVGGKSVMIWTEQGIGDEILYASMIGDMVKRSGRCVIECSQRLVPIFARSFPGVAVAGWEYSQRPASPTETIDVQIAAGSLGRYLRPDFASFPRQKSFLRADPAATAKLRSAYEARANGRRIVGLAWRSKNETIGPAKSARLVNLAPILTTPGIFFVNMQYGDCDGEIKEVRETLGVEIHQDPAVDALENLDAAFSQAAAMDLVITSSNSAAHIAGAQGAPVWIMLPHAKGVLWYWFAHRADCPWYPSARLFRTPTETVSEPWETGLAHTVAAALADSK